MNYSTEQIKAIMEKTGTLTKVEEAILEIVKRYGDNAPYILPELVDELRYLAKVENRTAEDYEGYEALNPERVATYHYERVLEMAERIDNYRLTPANAKVGDGATVHYYTDAEAGTIIKVTKTTITIQEDKATLDPSFKPEFIVGGFAAHCTNQDEQSYTYERDPNGRTWVFYWSKKWNRYGQPNDLRPTRGRHKFYDYNF